MKLEEEPYSQLNSLLCLTISFSWRRREKSAGMRSTGESSQVNRAAAVNSLNIIVCCGPMNGVI